MLCWKDDEDTDSPRTLAPAPRSCGPVPSLCRPTVGPSATELGPRSPGGPHTVKTPGMACRNAPAPRFLEFESVCPCTLKSDTAKGSSGRSHVASPGGRSPSRGGAFRSLAASRAFPYTTCANVWLPSLGASRGAAAVPAITSRIPSRSTVGYDARMSCCAMGTLCRTVVCGWARLQDRAVTAVLRGGYVLAASPLWLVTHTHSSSAVVLKRLRFVRTDLL